MIQLLPFAALQHAILRGFVHYPFRALPHQYRRAHRHVHRTPPQHRHRRPRRPWQDHPRRLPAQAVRHLLRTHRARRTRDGQQRPGKGTWHHDPVQEHRHHLAGQPHQHRRHARPRRLRRRSRARAVDGRLGADPGRCDGRPDAADALRDPEGVRDGLQADRRGQQDRPPGRAPGLGDRPGVRPVRQARRDQRAARLPDRLRLGAARLRQPGRQRARRRHDPAVRSDHAARVAAVGGSRRSVPDAHQPAGLQQLRRPDRRRPHPARQGAHQHAGQRDRPPRQEAPGQGAAGARLHGPGARRSRGSRGRRHRRHFRRRRPRHLRHHLRAGHAGSAAAR